MLRGITSFAVRHRWKTLLVWVVLGAALTVVGQTMMYSVTNAESGDFLPDSYDSAAALRIAEREFGEKPDSNAVTLLAAREDGERLTRADQRRIEETADRLGSRRIEADKPEPFGTDYAQTPRVSPASLSPDRTFQLLTVSLHGNLNDPALHEVYKKFRDSARKDFARAGLRTGFTGGIADTVDSLEANESTQNAVHMLTLGLIVLLNVLAFRSILAALVPLVAVTVVGGVGLGAVVGMAKLFDIQLDASTPSLIGVVLLGIGIDYFLFQLFRFRELLRARPGQPARATAAEASGRVSGAVASAALTIVAAFATLGLAGFGQFRVLGPAIAVAVLVMLLASLTLMPALLSLFGRAMFWPSRSWKRERGGGPSARLGLAVSRRPVRYACGALALMGVLAAGVTGVKMSYDQPEGKETAASRVSDEIARSLPAGATDPHTVYVRSTSGRALDRGAVRDLADAVGGVDGVGKVGRPALSEDGSAARFPVVLGVGSESQRARDLVSGPVRSALARHAPEGAEAHITGTAAVFADISTAVEKDLRLVFPVAAGLIGLILLLLLRSLVAPLVLMAVIGCGFVATLGAATLVFQHTLDRPGVSFTLPLVLFLFVVALGTDYNILISDRIREEMAGPVPARRAVAEAVRHTAPTIATAGLVLAGSFGALVADPQTQELGFSTGLGILLSALVLATVLAPALAALLGRALWWPRRPRGAHPGHRRGPEHEAADGDRTRAPAVSP
ncbi:MMPL family transporter [Streptomyces boncukensis]|uniref:MMPL family transporter n=1 Tax=Streptomyces boncukensis TaxID=2711219 RepID=A0A6G4X4K5_9ACTN|nr:MMPL family transporter [Streptomyces boncukensis]NGO72062.1 MMPL family transporter [Streptomyces boncukensis]